MKIGFVVPVLADYDLSKSYESIKRACADSKVEFDVIYAFTNKLTSVFSQTRQMFSDKKEVKAFKVDQNVNKHKLITLAMKDCEKYSATIIYSGKEEINEDVIKAFISSWRAGNKIVYLKKLFYGPKRIFSAIKEVFYKFGMKLLNCFKDYYAETDIQLLDQDVVKTINKLPAKNRILRTMDSFIGYNYDIIHMEVDSKLQVSKYYEEKTKDYKWYATFGIASGVLCLADFIMVIIATSLSWKIGLLWMIMMILGVFIFFTGWLVCFTKRILSSRVGRLQNEQELHMLEESMEKYNF